MPDELCVIGFDDIDQAAPIERQQAMFDRVHHLATRRYAFADKDAARQHFTRLTGLFKNLNYAAPGSGDEARLIGEIGALAVIDEQDLHAAAGRHP